MTVFPRDFTWVLLHGSKWLDSVQGSFMCSYLAAQGAWDRLHAPGHQPIRNCLTAGLSGMSGQAGNTLFGIPIHFSRGLDWIYPKRQLCKLFNDLLIPVPVTGKKPMNIEVHHVIRNATPTPSQAKCGSVVCQEHTWHQLVKPSICYSLVHKGRQPQYSCQLLPKVLQEFRSFTWPAAWEPLRGGVRKLNSDPSACKVDTPFFKKAFCNAAKLLPKSEYHEGSWLHCIWSERNSKNPGPAFTASLFPSSTGRISITAAFF